MSVDLQTQEALKPFAGMVELTMCGQPGSQMVHGSEAPGIVDFNTSTINMSSVLASDNIDLSSLSGPEQKAAKPGPIVAGPRKPTLG